MNIIKNAGKKIYRNRTAGRVRDSGLLSAEPADLSRDALWRPWQRRVKRFMERYFEGDEFSVEEIRSAMRTEVMDGDIVPVAMGSNIQAQGVANLLVRHRSIFPES